MLESTDRDISFVYESTPIVFVLESTVIRIRFVYESTPIVFVLELIGTDSCYRLTEIRSCLFPD